MNCIKSVIPAIMLALALGSAGQADEGILSHLFDRDHDKQTTEVKTDDTKIEVVKPEKPAKDQQTPKPENATEKSNDNSTQPCKEGEKPNPADQKTTAEPPAETPSESTADVTSAAVVTTPVAETPAAEKPATETPATETPATETPATETPAAETPAAEKPASEDASDKECPLMKTSADPGTLECEEQVWICQVCPCIIVIKCPGKTSLMHCGKPMALKDGKGAWDHKNKHGRFSKYGKERVKDKIDTDKNDTEKIDTEKDKSDNDGTDEYESKAEREKDM